jgi:hypothetical protein
MLKGLRPASCVSATALRDLPLFVSFTLFPFNEIPELGA